MAVASPVVERIGSVAVVRDDLLPGGTKVRVLPSWLPVAEEYVYASPAYGYAQIALAVAARSLGRSATIFTAARRVPHPRTAEAIACGAKVVMVPSGYLSVVSARARAYCEASGALLLPFGFDDSRFIGLLADVARSLPVAPSEVWCAAGSGVLARALGAAWPGAVVNAVGVGCDPVLPAGAVLHRAPERFEVSARVAPPFPSCSNYDAKAWRFVSTLAAPGALFWNVAA